MQLDNSLLYPTELREDDSLSDSEKKLYVEMLLHSEGGICKMKNNLFVTIFQKNRRTIIRWKRHLEDRGYIKTVILGRGDSHMELFSVPIQRYDRKKSDNGEKSDTPTLLSTTACKGSSRYNNHNKLINTRNNKENTKRERVTLKKGSAFQECIAIWNYQKNVPRHPNPGTLVWKTISGHIHKLRHGAFGEGKYFSDEYLSKTGITNRLIERVFTKEEIIHTIKRIALCYQGEYEPKNKSKLPKSLADAIHNPRTGSSVFLNVFRNAPVLVGDISERKDRAIKDNANPLITDMFAHRIGEGILLGRRDRMEKLIEGVADLVEYHEHMPCQDHHTVSWRLGTPHKLCIEYLKWLKGQDWMDRIEVGMITSKSRTFDMFLTEIGKELGVSLGRN